MHPARPPGNSGGGTRESGPRRTPPIPAEYPARPPSAQPSLPSIRQLHPYLHPSSLQPHGALHPDIPPAPYISPVHYVPTGLSEPAGLKRSYDPSGIDSELDEGDHSNSPPKKKRRRQALSCTECKRRKIKCDRTQPCTPCTRRGEQSRCQWHIVEPVEKYVTRAEYDELKTRFDEVSAKVDRLQHLYGSFYHTGMPPGPPGTSPEAMSTYGGSAPLAYQPMINPPQTHHLDTLPPQGPPPSRTTDPKDIHQPRHHQSPSLSSTQPVSPILRRPTPNDKVPGSSAPAKQSPLSLASITTPFHPDAQPKNYHAQTFSLGERLRIVARLLLEGATKDPAVLSAKYPRLLALKDLHLTRGNRRRCIWNHPGHQVTSWARRQSGLPIQHITDYHRHETVIGDPMPFMRDR